MTKKNSKNALESNYESKAIILYNSALLKVPKSIEFRLLKISILARFLLKIEERV
jgi:hypothetical protein